MQLNLDVFTTKVNQKTAFLGYNFGFGCIMSAEVEGILREVE